MMEAIELRPATAADHEAIAGVLESSWCGTTGVVHAAVYDPLDLPALLAMQNGRIIGLLTYLASDEALRALGRI